MNGQNGAQAVPTVQENESCRGWIWDRCIPIWPSNGIPDGMASFARRLFCPEVTVQFGGNAARGMNGKQRSILGLMAVAVQSAPEELCFREKMIWKRYPLYWLPNGIQTKMVN